MSAAIDYPVSLAVEDFVPVLLTTAGVLSLRRAFPRGRRITLAAALIGAGGTAKATAKLIAALDGPHLNWLSGMLFPLLTLGFGLLCLELARTSDGRVPRWLTVLVPGLTAVCALGAVLAGDPLPMLVSTSVFATLAGIRLIGRARERGDTATAALFGVQLLVFFILGPLASRPDQTVALQWVEQLCNTAAQAAYLIAARRLSAAPRPTFPSQPQETNS
ncbi:hypothetical protein LTV02_12545 [Nocardia yamanashiensis]|uniref:hypothetical protein n=1 Tax=Nocardia yamanashiensis TaxID=209247 RepID=UPI001E448F63|nr:hypothetical protein [Nocardia yamanashiensis]UGT44161.1 hypothetical protein LTV02_12545 [Nocardia yamanashiensis]